MKIKVLVQLLHKSTEPKLMMIFFPPLNMVILIKCLDPETIEQLQT